jgi:inner membrane protein involved in colicin E2 resistance
MNGIGYCERASAAFWAEPLNALSNAAFIVAALAGLVIWRRAGGRDFPAALAIGLVFAIGVGSFLFHTMPSRVTLLADVVPIQLFAFGYFGLALYRLLGLGLAASVVGTAAFFAAALALASGLGPFLPEGARGSAGYAAFVLGLFGVGFALRKRAGGRRRAGLLLGAGFVFAVSLILRSLDGSLCSTWPLGLHWAWHLLNALVLFLLLRAALDPAGDAAH